MTQVEFNAKVNEVTDVNAPYDRVHQMAVLKKFFTDLGEKLFETRPNNDTISANRTAQLATVAMIKIMLSESNVSEAVAKAFTDYQNQINNAVA